MYTVNKLLHYILAWSKCTFSITIIHVDLLLSFALFTWVIIRIIYFHLCSIKRKTKNILNFLMSFYSENRILLLYVTRIRVNQSNMEVQSHLFTETIVFLSISSTLF